MNLVIIIYKNSDWEVKIILSKVFRYFQKYTEPLLFLDNYRKKINVLLNKPNYIYSPFVNICINNDFEYIAEQMKFYTYEDHQYGLLAAIKKGLILAVITIVPRSPVNIEEAIKYAKHYNRWRICAYLLKF